MSRRKITAGTTSLSMPIFIQDTSSTTGAGLGSLVYNSAGLAARYRRKGQSSWTTITMATMTLGTWTSGGFVTAGGVTGKYEFGVPDAAIATGVEWVEIELHGATNMLAVLIEFELDTINYQAAGGKVPATIAAGDLATDSITGAAVKADAVTKIQAGLPAAVWDYLTSAGTTVGSIGKALVDLVNAYTSARAAKLDRMPAAGTVAVAGDAMALTPAERESTAVVLEGHLLDEGDGQLLINAMVGAIGNTNIDQAVLIAAMRADLERTGGNLHTLLARLTTQRAANLENLDAAVSETVDNTIALPLMIENVAGTNRWKASSLTQAPAGEGGGGSSTVEEFTPAAIAQLRAANIVFRNNAPTIGPMTLYSGIDHLQASGNGKGFRNPAGSWLDLSTGTVYLEVTVDGKSTRDEAVVVVATGTDQELVCEMHRDKLVDAEILQGTGTYLVVHETDAGVRTELRGGALDVHYGVAPAA